MLERNSEFQNDLFVERLHETVSAASKRTDGMDKLHRIKSLTTVKRKLSSAKVHKGKFAINILH